MIPVPPVNVTVPAGPFVPYRVGVTLDKPVGPTLNTFPAATSCQIVPVGPV